MKIFRVSESQVEEQRERTMIIKSGEDKNQNSERISEFSQYFFLPMTSFSLSKNFHLNSLQNADDLRNKIRPNPIRYYRKNGFLKYKIQYQHTSGTH